MGIAPAIDLTADQRRTVLSLLRRHLPNTAVWAYGSRAKWTSHPASDLDLVAFATSQQGPRIAELREAFDESTLPFVVALFVWDDVPMDFRKRIEAEHVVLAKEEPPVCVEWPTATLGDFIDMNEATHNPNETWPFVNYLDTGNITQNRIDKIQHLVVGKDEIPSRARRKVQPGDIVYSTVRPNQRHFGLLKDVSENFLASTGFAVIRAKENRASTDFLYWFLAQDSVVEHLHTIAEHSASAYPSIRPPDIERLTLRLPPLPEQQAIADVLCTLDDKIALNRGTVETLEQAFIALFNSWLAVPADTDLPDGWSVRSLDEIAHFQNGLALQKYRPLAGEERLPVLKIAELRKGTTGGKEYASANIPSECIVENGDLIFSWSGSLMAKIWCGGRAALNQHLFKVTSSDLPDWFVFGWLSRHMSEFQLIAADKATTMGHIRRHHLQDAQCVLPNDDVMETANRVCGAIHRRCIAARVESGRLAVMREMLLPKLISGEIRVDEAEKLAEAAT